MKIILLILIGFVSGFLLQKAIHNDTLRPFHRGFLVAFSLVFALSAIVAVNTHIPL